MRSWWLSEYQKGAALAAWRGPTPVVLIWRSADAMRYFIPSPCNMRRCLHHTYYQMCEPKRKEPVPTPSSSRTSALPHCAEWYIHFACIIPRLFFAPYFMSWEARARARRLIFMKFGPAGKQRIQGMHNALNISPLQGRQQMKNLACGFSICDWWLRVNLD
jgi:hypothetical protein